MDVEPIVLAFAAAAPIANIAGTEIVKEMTKDAYRSFKEHLYRLLGDQGGSAVALVEADPLSVSARDGLSVAISKLDFSALRELKACADAFARALASDEAAHERALSNAHVRLDVDSGLNASISNFDIADGAGSFEADVRSGGNVEIRNIRLGK